MQLITLCSATVASDYLHSQERPWIQENLTSVCEARANPALFCVPAAPGATRRRRRGGFAIPVSPAPRAPRDPEVLLLQFCRHHPVHFARGSRPAMRYAGCRRERGSPCLGHRKPQSPRKGSGEDLLPQQTERSLFVPRKSQQAVQPRALGVSRSRGTSSERADQRRRLQHQRFWVFNPISAHAKPCLAWELWCNQLQYG